MSLRNLRSAQILKLSAKGNPMRRCPARGMSHPNAVIKAVIGARGNFEQGDWQFPAKK
jgi:hypothetical protein